MSAAIDMRHDKFLHSPARAMRRFAWALGHRGEPVPKEWTEEPREKSKPLKHVSARRQAHTYRGFHDAEFRKFRFADRRAARKAARDYRPQKSEAKRASHRECERRVKQAAKTKRAPA